MKGLSKRAQSIGHTLVLKGLATKIKFTSSHTFQFSLTLNILSKLLFFPLFREVWKKKVSRKKKMPFICKPMHRLYLHLLSI